MPTRKRERVLLVGVSGRANPRALAEEHLDELARLAETAGADVVGRFVQERAAPDPATYIGKGAAEKLGQTAEAQRADLVIFDDELTPGQARNLEERWGGDPRARPAGGHPRRLRDARALARGAHPGGARAAPVSAAAPDRPVPAPLGARRAASGRAAARANRSSSSTAARSATGSRTCARTSRRSRSRGRSGAGAARRSSRSRSPVTPTPARRLSSTG